LNDELHAAGYEDLPYFPAKALIKNNDVLSKRKRDLNLYCKEVISRKDLRNSAEVI